MPPKSNSAFRDFLAAIPGLLTARLSLGILAAAMVLAGVLTYPGASDAMPDWSKPGFRLWVFSWALMIPLAFMIFTAGIYKVMASNDGRQGDTSAWESLAFLLGAALVPFTFPVFSSKAAPDAVALAWACTGLSLFMFAVVGYRMWRQFHPKKSG